ncbi:MAG: PilT/PilU family type 4a pilus ATPase [Candidatus Hydrogenedentota bacterium]
MLDDILNSAAALGASDIHFHIGVQPVVRLHGDLTPMENFPALSPDHLKELAAAIFRPGQATAFDRGEEIDTSYSLAGVGRFRCNIFKQRGTIGIVMRRISNHIPTIDELNLPAGVEYLTRYQRGLVLVTGMTGSGKSTTLAAMIGRINSTRRCHIVTLEDPIEYLHHDNISIVTQREIGQDSMDFARALRSVLRQDPDVILIGEMRDAETIKIALTAAETGHLVLSTLHTTTAPQSIERMLEYFQPEMRPVIRQQMAFHLRGIVSQRLLTRLDGHGMIPAVEIMLMNPVVQKKVIEGKIGILKSVIHQASNEGMQTFDQHLVALYNAQLVSYEEAQSQCSNPDSFPLYCQGFFSDIVSGMEG